MTTLPHASGRALSIGIVGAGDIVRRAHLPVLLNMPAAQVAWLYDQSSDRASELGTSYGVNALHSLTPDELPVCDVALLAIPVDARAPYLRHFARRETAVLCEKPFALQASQHEDAVRGFDAHRIACGFMRRFYRSTGTLRRIVREGWFGPLRAIDISEGNRSKGSGSDASFLDDPRLGAARGVLADLGSHGLDLALFVSGATGYHVEDCRKVLDGSVDRKVSARVHLSGGACGHGVPLEFSVSWLDRQDNRICLQFERTSVWTGLSPAADVLAGDPRHPEHALTLQSSRAGASTYNQAFYLEWRDFLDGVREGRNSTCSAYTAALTSSLLETLLQHRGVA